MAIASLRIPSDETDAVILDLPEPVTEEMLIALASENPQYRLETTAEGRLVVSPGTGTFSSGGEAELVAQIVLWNRQNRLGRVTSSSGMITLADGAIKGPDATFISEQRLRGLSPTREKRAYEQIAPDAVFELVSPTDRVKTLEAKCEAYIASGAAVAVLVNPRNRTVTLFRTRRDPVVTGDDTVAIGDEMPGFVLDATAVFDAGADFAASNSPST